jgi:hypothetical protein
MAFSVTEVVLTDLVRAMCPRTFSTFLFTSSLLYAMYVDIGG